MTILGQKVDLNCAGRLVLHVMRLYLGAWMVINGLNHWLPIFPQPFGGTPLSQLYITSLVDTGLFGVAKAIEVIGGVLLILNLFTPLGLAILLPVSMMVYFNATYLQGRWFRIWGDNGIYMGTVCLYFNLILMVTYLRYYLPMLSIRSTMGSLGDIGLLSQIGGDLAERQDATHPAPPSPSRTKYAFLSIGTGLALCLLVAWQQSIIADFSPTSGKTARGFIGDYLELAYDKGRGADARAAFFAPDAKDHAPDAIDRTNGTPIPHEIRKIVADGMTVAVYHKISAARGRPTMEVVDIYEADRFSRIQEHWQIVQSVRE